MGVIQAGTYEKLRVNGSGLKDGKTEGEPVIMIYLEDPDSGDFITDYLYTSNAAWDKVTAPRLKAYGWNPEEHNFAISELNKVEGNPIANSFVGPVVIKEETYQDKPQLRVAQVGEFVREQMNQDEAEKFEAQLRARLTAGRPAAAKAAKPKTSAPPRPTVVEPDIYNDDVGF